MNDRPHTVVGVLPPFPQYPQEVDVYMPTSACPFRSNPARWPTARTAMGQPIGAGIWDGVRAGALANRCRSRRVLGARTQREHHYAVTG